MLYVVRLIEGFRDLRNFFFIIDVRKFFLRSLGWLELGFEGGKVNREEFERIEVIDFRRIYWKVIVFVACFYYFGIIFECSLYLGIVLGI